MKIGVYDVERLPFDWKSLKESCRIDNAIKLTNINKSLIIIIFLKDYWDADLIAKANFIKGGIRWGQNGSIMYIAESSDQNKVSKVLSTFAGEE